MAGFSKDNMVTGGAGFIGSHVDPVIRKQISDLPHRKLDAFTYAGNLENLKDIESDPNYTFREKRYHR